MGSTIINYWDFPQLVIRTTEEIPSQGLGPLSQKARDVAECYFLRGEMHQLKEELPYSNSLELGVECNLPSCRYSHSLAEFYGKNQAYHCLRPSHRYGP